MVAVFDDKPSLLDSIALKLDSAKKPVGNWRSLATKLISSGQEFKEFEAQLHSSENPTALLFRYLSKHEEFNQLTVGDLKGHLKNMKRNDILMVLDEVQGLYLKYEYVVCFFSLIADEPIVNYNKIIKPVDTIIYNI